MNRYGNLLVARTMPRPISSGVPESPISDEALIVDERSHRTPARIVEDKLRSHFMPLSLSQDALNFSRHNLG